MINKCCRKRRKENNKIGVAESVLLPPFGLGEIGQLG